MVLWVGVCVGACVCLRACFAVSVCVCVCDNERGVAVGTAHGHTLTHL